MFSRERPLDHQRLAEPKPNSFSVLVTIDGQLVDDLEVPLLTGPTPQNTSPEKAFHERQLATGVFISACRFPQLGLASLQVNPELITVRHMDYYLNMQGSPPPRLTKLEISRHHFYKPFFVDAGGVLAYKPDIEPQGNFYSIRGWVKATGESIEMTVVYNY